MVSRMEVPGLTSDLLRSLYLDECLTETQIAGRFGINQVQVGRFRKRWGIPTLSIGDRVGKGLPELTDLQKQLLVGSLLGDGGMRATSPQSARFNEGHSMKQSAYTDWKAGLLGPFVSSFHKGTKIDKSTGKVFHTRIVASHACPQLRPYYDLFYPAPEHKRIFPASLPDLMTPFVFAVWYMDDGSVTVKGYPRIAFGLDDLSLERACKALRNLGLRPKVYGEGGGRGIHFPKQTMIVRNMIEAFVPECMAYKLPFESEGQRVRREARLLTSDNAKSLYEGGASVKSIAEMFQVGTSTVNRRLAEAHVVKRSKGPCIPVYTLDVARELLGQYPGKDWGLLTEGEKSALVDEVFHILRRSPFPATPVFTSEQAAHALMQVVKSDMVLDHGCVSPIRKVGISLCNSLFLNRYKASSRGVKTAYEAWHLDDHLKRAIRFQFDFSDPVLPHRVLRAITMQCRTPSIFRPTVAKYIYEHYCPKGGTTWDPCSGYGGRLLGAVAAGVKYVGTDVEADTVEGNRRLASLLGIPADLYLCQAEDFDPPPVDLVFTSPPYFNRELYSHSAYQSWVKHPGFDSWVDGFLRQVVKKAFKALRGGGFLVLNVADVREHKQILPLVDRTIEVAEQEGFTLVDRLKMPLPKLNRTNPHEPILVFKLG